MELNQTVKLQLGIPEDNESKDPLIASLVSRAKAKVLAYCNLPTDTTDYPKDLDEAIIEMAVIGYNRIGVEGLSSQSQGGISVGIIEGIPSDIKALIRRHRRLLK